MKQPEVAEEEAADKPPPTTEEKIEFLDYLEDKYGELSRKCVVNQDLMDDYFLKNDALKSASEQGFLATTLHLKKRVNFLGIYDMHEKSEMIYNEVKRLTQNRLTNIVKKYKHHQGMLLHYQKIRWNTGNAKLFTENLPVMGVFHHKLLMDQAPESVDEFMGQKHSASLVRTPKGSMDQPSDPLLQGASQATPGPPETLTAVEDKQPGAGDNWPAQFEVMQNEILLQNQHRRKYQALVSKLSEAPNDESGSHPGNKAAGIESDPDKE